MKRILLLLTCIYVCTYTLHAQAESDVVITEIMYNPPGSDTLEYIELFNKSNAGINLTGWSFTNGITHSFSGVFMSPGSYLVMTNDEDAFEGVFGINVLQWEAGGLNNGGEALVLRNGQDMVMDTVRYRDSDPWPTGPIDPDGDGASIVLCDPEADNNEGTNWISGDVPTGIFINNEEIYGHPGATCAGTDLIPPIAIHAEAISATQIIVEFNEAVNATAELSTNYSGLGNLTADRDATSQIVTLTLDTPLSDGVLTTFTVTGTQDFPGNQMTLVYDFDVIWHSTGEVRDIVITEIMYNAPGNDSLDFIELYNNAGVPRNLWGCFFDKGIDFTFPNYTMQPGDYLILAEDSVNFELTYGITPFKWSGELDNNSEKIILNFIDGDTIDLVDYNDNNGWNPLADGEGYSLVLCDPNSDNTDTLNWSIATTTTNIIIGDTLEMFANPGMADSGCPVGIEDTETLTGIDVYPNPNTGIFTIQHEEHNTLEYAVFDLFGRMIEQDKLTTTTHEIDLQNAPNGVYLLYLKNIYSGKYTTRKIVVAK